MEEVAVSSDFLLAETGLRVEVGISFTFSGINMCLCGEGECVFCAVSV